MTKMPLADDATRSPTNAVPNAEEEGVPKPLNFRSALVLTIVVELAVCG